MKWRLLLLLLALAPACTTSRAPAPSSPPPIAVRTEPVAMRALRGAFEAGGVVRAKTTATVASRIVATVLSVEAGPGDRVRAGQRLVVLDGRDLEANAGRAKASMTALQHAAVAATADRDAAQTALTLTRATHVRVAELAGRKSATPHELDEAVAALGAADARVTAAGARVAEARAALDAARAEAAATAVMASFAELRAPFDGVVSEKLIEAGNLASVGTPLLRVEDTTRYRAEVRIDESRAARVAVGQTVEVVAGSGTGIVGRVAEVSRDVDAASHAVLVKIDLAPHRDLRSGLFARARFEGDTRGALTVPRSAVVPQGQLATVFVVTDSGRARMRVIRTGEPADCCVEVVAGLASGEAVIVSPPPGLRDGDAVRPAAGPAAGGQ
jgi:RND family efflux transporter MFP subunit